MRFVLVDIRGGFIRVNDVGHQGKVIEVVMYAKVTISGSIGGIFISTLEVDVDVCMPKKCLLYMSSGG
jgi:hypothetical protein